MTITHEIRFSTLTPTRVNLLEDFVGQPARLAHNATDAELASSHDSWSQTSPYAFVYTFFHLQQWVYGVIVCPAHTPGDGCSSLS
jgi:hypothetical protein